jgi:hypothetical protein
MKYGALPVLAIALFVGTVAASDAPGIVSHILVLSDKSEDVSSPEAWKKTYIKDGMTDQEKAQAIWRTVVKYRHQTNPPNEWFYGENVHDPIKTINVYGYGMCCCASSNIEGLGRYIGLIARGRTINQHSVPELSYDNSWHLYDASLMNYFVKTDGKVASVEEIRDAVQGWLKDNPKLKGNDNALRAFAKSEGWKKGPELLASSKFYNADGINPAGWHGWPSNMQEYDIKNPNVFDYGPTMGYQVNIQLRSGEKLTRNWFNKGLHVNMQTAPDLDVLKGRGALGFQRQLGDLAPGRVGNGTLEYNVPLASGAFRSGALTADNLASTADDKAAPALHLKDAAKPGTLIVRMPCSYVYLGGQVSCKATVGDGGSIDVSFSENNGLDFKPVQKIDKSGDQTIDLKKLVFRRYDYQLKFELNGAGTGLDTLRISNDIQHSQAPLPIIVEGENTITFNAGAQEGTVTYEGNMAPDQVKDGRQICWMEYHPKLNGLEPNVAAVGGSGKGDATLTLNAPGEMTRIRMSFHWRARDAADGYEVQVSYDDGKTFKTVDKLTGPTPACTKYIVVGDVPAGTKTALVRLNGSQRNTTCLFNMRVDADYKEPNGGFRPVKITYVWDEDGKEKKDEHVAKAADDTYKINCGAKTTPKSVILELAD